MTDQLPLTGIRVLDMTNVLAGPFAAYQLALAGADVIKVEAPGGGDLARSLGADPEMNASGMGTSFIAQNSGKRSIAIDLKTASGKEALTALIRSADVLVENFRPGVLARLEFSTDRLTEINPRLIYCAISGFGQTGPLRDRPAYDQIVQGLAGMMDVTGTESTGPLRAGYPVADSLGGMAAAFAISTALVERARTGRGKTIDVSMLESAITSMGWVVSNHLLAGRAPSRLGNENFTAAPSGTFETGSGLINISANKQEQFEMLCEHLERADLIRDPRFITREDRKQHRLELKHELESALAARSAEEWEEGLAGLGVPAGRVLSIGDTLEHPQIQQRELVHRVVNPLDNGEDFHVLGNGIRMDARPSAPRSGPPMLGEHTDAVLREVGLDEDMIARFRAEGGVR